MSLCNIVEASETDQTKRNRKLEEKATLEERIRAEKEELLKAEERERAGEREVRRQTSLQQLQTPRGGRRRN